MIVGCMWFDIPAAHIWLVIPKAPAEYKSDCEAKKQVNIIHYLKPFATQKVDTGLRCKGLKENLHTSWVAWQLV